MYAQIRSSQHRFVFSVPTLVIAAFATACGSTERPAEEDTPTTDIPNVILIENGEDGDATLLKNEEQGVLGYWYSYDDRQECVHPDFKAQMTAPCGSEACAAAGSANPTQPPTRPYGGDFTTAKYAAGGTDAPPPEGKQKKNEGGIHLTGGGEMYFGAGVGVALNNPGTLQPFNMTAAGFTGVRFLAKSGNGMPIRLRVKIKDAFSEPAGGNCDVRENVCDGTTCQCCDETKTMCDPGLGQGCHDDPIAPVMDTEVKGATWQVFEIPFSKFKREGWGTHTKGTPPPSADLDATQAYQLQFQVQTTATPATEPLPDFDLWLDNIGFMTGDPTPAPMGTLVDQASSAWQ